jgi:hypothetical protein
MDFKALVGGAEEGLSLGLSIEALARLLEFLDDPIFCSQWLEYLRTTKNYVEREHCHAGLARVMRSCGERATRSRNNLTNMRWGMGIGTSLLGGSLIAMATTAAGSLFVVPVVAGAVIAVGSMSQMDYTAQRERLYKDIEARIAKILAESDER